MVKRVPGVLSQTSFFLTPLHLPAPASSLLHLSYTGYEYLLLYYGFTGRDPANKIPRQRFPGMFFYGPKTMLYTSKTTQLLYQSAIFL
jgi:hypothetical protein